MNPKDLPEHRVLRLSWADARHVAQYVNGRHRHPWNPPRKTECRTCRRVFRLLDMAGRTEMTVRIDIGGK